MIAVLSTKRVFYHWSGNLYPGFCSHPPEENVDLGQNGGRMFATTTHRIFEKQSVIIRLHLYLFPGILTGTVLQIFSWPFYLKLSLI